MSLPLRVLLVEDNADDALLLEHALGMGDYAPVVLRVETADAFREVLAREPWDVVIADYSLPRFSGMAALQIVREFDPNVPFLMVSGAVGEERIVEVMRAGAGDFILKDHLVRLLPAVTRELHEAAVRRERRQVQHALEQSEMRFRQLADSMPQLVWTADPDGRVDYYNERRKEYHGIIPDATGAYQWGPVLHPDDLAPTEAAWKQAVRTGEVYQVEHRVQRADGSYRWHLSRGVPIHDEAGQIVKWYGTATDIHDLKMAQTERERLLEEVQRRALELDVTLDAIADGVIIFDRDSYIVRMNALARRMLGYAPEEFHLPLQIRSWTSHMQRLDGSPMPLEETASWRALQGETVQGSLGMLVLADNTRMYISASAAPICTPDGTLIGAIATFTDVTELHHAQEQERRLLYTVAHDLRAPATIIRGHVALLLEQLPETRAAGPLASTADALHRALRRMDKIVDDLTLVTQLESGRPLLEAQPLALAAYLDELLTRNAGVLQRDRIMLEMPPTLPSVQADPDRLERILLNLLLNAQKYAYPATPIRLTAHQQEEMVVISVQDLGQGIPPEDLPHIFDRYYRAETGRKAEGIGLGLYITRMLVEAHGGTIHAESEPGHGSTFTFTLPAVMA